jgi:small subunit ribosomal protein S15
VALHPTTDAETTPQMSRVRIMATFLTVSLKCHRSSGSPRKSDPSGDSPRKSDYTELVARALHRVEFRASQKGSQDKYLGVCAMALTVEKKGGIVAQFRRDTSDTGSPEVQVALLSERINGLGEHFTAHKRDHSSRRGLVKLVNQRRKLLDYLKSTQPQKYQELVERLGLRR